MSQGEKRVFDYSDGRTKQSFRDSTDVNKILKRAQITGSLSHLETYGGQYGDFTGFDYFEAQVNIAKMKEVFDALPSEVRRDFGQDPNAFFEFANKAENVGKMAELLPEIAEPGSYFPSVKGVGSGQPESVPVAAENPPASPPLESGDEVVVG